MKNLISIVIAITLISLTGCASIASGTKESVNVSTGPITGAHCSLSNNKGTWQLNETPGNVTVHRSSNTLAVNCFKQGHKPAYMLIASKTNPMSYGNILTAGIIGQLVDKADGAAYKYPENIAVHM